MPRQAQRLRWRADGMRHPYLSMPTPQCQVPAVHESPAAVPPALGHASRSTRARPVFVEVAAPTDVALQTVLRKIITRMMKLLTRKGVLVEEQGQAYMADDDSDSDEARTLRPLQAAACTYRIAFGPRAGQKVLTVQGAT